MTKRKTSAKTGYKSLTRSDYRIPTIWNCWGESETCRDHGAETVIEPAAYLNRCIAWIKAQSSVRGRIAGRSLSLIQGVKASGKLRVRDGATSRRAGDWIKRGTMYGMMIRCATAWDHDGDGKLNAKRFNELGTFLKTILLLPHLRRLGVDVLYTLPVVHASKLYRKGELGCPYSAKDFLALDPDQADDAFGDAFGTINAQFRLLVECAHRLGMRIMLDLAPRTAARDCDWILEHPEWFYWIARKFERSYRAPMIPGATYVNPVPGRLNEIYDVPCRPGAFEEVPLRAQRHRPGKVAQLREPP
jgi:starch synthase (maltosyl-transferring)